MSSKVLFTGKTHTTAGKDGRRTEQRRLSGHQAS